jgi:anti-sigma factor RsiW
MKTDTLQALLIDRSLGELPPEVAELLDAHLANNPAARDEARRITETLDLAGETIRRFPERGHTAQTPNATKLVPFPARWLRLAASLLLAALAAGSGYVLGGRRVAAMASAPLPPPTLSAAPVVASAPLPWTRYEVISGRGDLRVVRVNSNP